MAFLDETGLAELWGCIDDAFGRMATGSYNGTDKSGSSNQNKLTFPFAPKLVIVTATDGKFAIMVNGSTKAASLQVSSPTNAGALNYHYLTVSWSGNGVSWYSGASVTPTTYQLNQSGKTYYYIALG